MLRTISLFSGAGGMDYGFEAAGFETAVAVEMDRDCCETLRRNRRWPVIERSVFDVPTREILETAGVGVGDADLLCGGPPCQPFSKGGYWVRGDSARLNDPRADTLGAYLRVLEEAQPKAFVLENVAGLAFAGKDEGLRLLHRRIGAINRKLGTSYRPEWRVLNAADHGVPQVRSRGFLVAMRDGGTFEFPEVQFGSSRPGELRFDGLEPYRTAWDAIGDLGRPDDEKLLALQGKWARLVPSIPEGHNYLWHTTRGGGLPLFGWRTRYWTFLLKLAKDRPSWTIQAQPGPAVGPFHWDNRRLSMRELCRLQTFPDDIEIVGKRGSVQKQLGNAVPSLLAEVIGRALRVQMSGKKAPLGPPCLLRPSQGSAPKAERRLAVPKEYQELVGDHADHPGPGKGKRAIHGFQSAA